MGIMSRNARLPERPKPPSWQEISEDVSSAQQDNEDVAFVVGCEYLRTTTAAASCPPVLERSPNNSLHSPEVDSLDQGSPSIDADAVKTSKSNVHKLISLYTELNDSLGSLQKQYTHLKLVQGELSQSMSELNVLAQSVSSDVENQSGGSVSGKTSSKAKSKQKKKK
ncbi:unnamed protein product [Candidula unifasciata]|uniref:Uncharacterized protein n=1 Tax=Candidula unifasciata TaxID=100452 RepID=A0A8S3YFN3_9EUPU|nr:unnamed protein product [Candidula unifasciata]